MGHWGLQDCPGAPPTGCDSSWLVAGTGQTAATTAALHLYLQAWSLLMWHYQEGGGLATCPPYVNSVTVSS